MQADAVVEQRVDDLAEEGEAVRIEVAVHDEHGRIAAEHPDRQRASRRAVQLLGDRRADWPTGVRVAGNDADGQAPLVAGGSSNVVTSSVPSTVSRATSARRRLWFRA